MVSNLQWDCRDRLAERIGQVYREAMTTEPQRVEVHQGNEVLVAILYGASTLAEDDLRSCEEGCRLLDEYHRACARQMFAALDETICRTVGGSILHLSLDSVGPTKHKLLVIVLAPQEDSAP